jgi:DedD protein
VDAKAIPANPDPVQSDAPAKTPAVAPAAKQSAGAPPAYDTEAAPPKKAATDQARPQAKPVPIPPATIAQAPAAVEPPKVAQPADAKGAGGFVVQVAALNDAAKARQIQDQIAATGVKSYTEVVPTAKGNVTRVRAGPFATREEADMARDKLKGLGLSGNIVSK